MRKAGISGNGSKVTDLSDLPTFLIPFLFFEIREIRPIRGSLLIKKPAPGSGAGLGKV
jgi:hypothetical protein